MSKKYKISRIIFLILFIISCVILIIEAATPGTESANKSNIVSDTIASVINNISETITKEPKITNLEEFRALIRKLVGHYGAFLIMAIFASLTFMMYLNKKIWWFFWVKVLALILFGFVFASITELIQLNTPGRAGVFSDVLIDFSGYMTSVGIIVIVFFIMYYKQFKKDISKNTILDSNQEENKEGEKE